MMMTDTDKIRVLKRLIANQERIIKDQRESISDNRIRVGRIDGRITESRQLIQGCMNAIDILNESIEANTD